MQIQSLIYFSVGMGVAFLAPGIFQFSLPYTKKERPLIRKALASLERLNDEIFACFLQPSYLDTRYLFERRIHIQKNAFMQAMIALHHLKQSETHEMQKLNQLYDLMLSYAQLRWRISDHSVFLLCTDELSQLARIISSVLERASKQIRGKNFKLDFNYHQLPDAIESLEENYHQVLQVSAKEPINFLLFIANLKLFCEELMAGDESYKGVLP